MEINSTFMKRLNFDINMCNKIYGRIQGTDLMDQLYIKYCMVFEIKIRTFASKFLYQL